MSMLSPSSCHHRATCTCKGYIYKTRQVTQRAGIARAIVLQVMQKALCIMDGSMRQHRCCYNIIALSSATFSNIISLISSMKTTVLCWLEQSILPCYLPFESRINTTKVCTMELISNSQWDKCSTQSLRLNAAL